MVIQKRWSYTNPPIQEAVVEFHLNPTEEWDLTIPGKFHQHALIKNLYQGKPRHQQIQVGSALRTKDKAELSIKSGVGRVLLPDESGTKVVGIGSNLVSVISLKPYEGWESYQSRIADALSAYWDIANPRGVIRIGLRYINKVVFEGDSGDLGKYLKNFTGYVKGLPPIREFGSAVIHNYDDSMVLRISLASSDAPENYCGVIVDLDVIWHGEEEGSIEKILQIVDTLHRREGEAFETLITENAREVFNAKSY